MKIPKQKLVVLVVVGVVILGYLGYQYFTADTTLTTNTPLPAPALTVVTNYIQVREASVGADQATPNSWHETIQAEVTTDWLAKLQQAEPSADYAVAHSKRYLVKADVSSCIWDMELMKPSDSEGAALCDVNDSTIDQTTGAVIPKAALPASWIHEGAQSPAILRLVKQGDVWLVSEDLTGQGQ